MANGTANKQTNPSKKQTQSGGKQNTRTSKQTQQTHTKEEKKPVNKQNIATILFAVALILFFVALIPGESAWEKCHEAIYGAFGVCGIVIPVLLGYVSFIFMKEKPLGGLSFNLLGAGGISLLASSLAHIICNKAEYLHDTGIGQQIINAYEEKKFRSGGAVGAIFGSLAGKYLGKGGALIVLIILLAASILLFTQISIPLLMAYIRKPVKKISEVSNERKEVNARKLEELNEKFREEKEAEEEKSKQGPPLIDTSAKAKTPPAVKSNSAPSIPKIVIDEPPKTKNDTSEKPSQDRGTMPKGVDGNPEGFYFAPEFTQTPVADETLTAEINSAGSAEKPAKQVKKPAAAKQKPKAEARTKVEESANGEITVQTEKEYVLPPIECLTKSETTSYGDGIAEMQEGARKLIETLQSFKINAEVSNICRGPSVTRYELVPEAGVRINKITSLSDDIALRLAAQSVRIEAPIPGKSAIGIEIPNGVSSMVSAREIIDTDTYRAGALKSKLNVALGKDITGNVITADLSKMPHLLVAGTTGSGKSVCMNAMIISILYNASPDEVKLLMIDPKQVEFTVYNGISHLEVPVVSEPRKAAGALSWAVSEMEKRYKMFSENSVRDIKGFNKLAAVKDDLQKMHHIVIFIDELSDLMMAAPKEVEDSICRLAQMARAAGIHLVIATQSPRADVITGLIKANIPSRISLKVSNSLESRIILDNSGAEKLLGNGDMLFNPVGASKPVRIQGCYISDEEIEAIVSHVKSQSEAEYNEETVREIEENARAAENAKKGNEPDSDDIDELDPMFEKAVEVVLIAEMASTTMLQKKLKLGYARASRVIDQLEEQGIVGPANGAKPREILITKQMWYERQALAQGSGSGNVPASLYDIVDGRQSQTEESYEEELTEEDDDDGFFDSGKGEEDEEPEEISIEELNEPFDPEEPENPVEEEEDEESPEDVYDEYSDAPFSTEDPVNDGEFTDEDDFDDFDTPPTNIDDVFADDD